VVTINANVFSAARNAYCGNGVALCQFEDILKKMAKKIKKRKCEKKKTREKRVIVEDCGDVKGKTVTIDSSGSNSR
jgi:hypothetical protein